MLFWVGRNPQTKFSGIGFMQAVVFGPLKYLCVCVQLEFLRYNLKNEVDGESKIFWHPKDRNRWFRWWCRWFPLYRIDRTKMVMQTFSKHVRPQHPGGFRPVGLWVQKQQQLFLIPWPLLYLLVATHFSFLFSSNSQGETFKLRIALFSWFKADNSSHSLSLEPFLTASSETRAWWWSRAPEWLPVLVGSMEEVSKGFNTQWSHCDLAKKHITLNWTPICTVIFMPLLTYHWETWRSI